MQKKLFIWIAAIVVIVVAGFLIFTQMSTTKADYTTTQAEKQLNAGKSIDGKIVDVKIEKNVTDGPLGQDLWAGKHLNFYPSKQQYNLKKGQHILFKVSSAKSTLGSWYIQGSVVK